MTSRNVRTNYFRNISAREGSAARDAASGEAGPNHGTAARMISEGEDALRKCIAELNAKNAQLKIENEHLRAENVKLARRARKAKEALEEKKSLLSDANRLRSSLDDLLRDKEREQRMNIESQTPHQTFVFNLWGPDSPLRFSPQDPPSPERSSEKRARPEEDVHTPGATATKRRLFNE